MKTINVQSIDKKPTGDIFVDLNGDDCIMLSPLECDLFKFEGLEISGTEKNIDILIKKMTIDCDIEFDLSELNSKTPTKDETITALQLAANRADIPATGKQINYLASLIFDADKSAHDIGCGLSSSFAVLTQKSARLYINDYLNG